MITRNMTTTYVFFLNLKRLLQRLFRSLLDGKELILGGGEQPSEDRVATVRLYVGRLKIPSCLRDHYPTENNIKYTLKKMIIGR